MTSDATARAEADLVAICVSWPEWLEVLSVRPEHFSAPQWRLVYGAAQACAADGEAVTEATLWRRLEQRSGGEKAYEDLAAALVEAPPTGAAAESLAEVVRDGHVARQIYEAAGTLVQSYRDRDTGEAMLSEAMRRMSALDSDQPDGATPIAEVLRERYREIVRAAQAKERGEPACTGVPTGIEGLDGKTGGLQRGIVTLVAGRPGQGKSAVGITVTDHMTRSGVGVHVFSLEDTRARYADRLISRASGVAAEDIRSLNIAAMDMGALQRGANEMSQREGWLVDDRSGISAEEVVRSVRRARRRNETQVVIVDYIQLLGGRPGESKQERLDRSINALADAAKQDDMAYLVMSQMNRGGQSRDDKRPTLTDLRGAGELEERAKAVIGLHRPAYYGEKVPADDGGRDVAAPEDMLELIVLKQNDGDTGTVVANWDGPTMMVW